MVRNRDRGPVRRLAIANGADATQVGAVGILAAPVMAVGEVEEIQVACWSTIRFRRRPGQATPDDQE